LQYVILDVDAALQHERGAAMMRCPSFAFHAPASVEEAAEILAGEGERAMLIGGGTDLVPNMKRRTQTPRVLVSLRRVGGLRGISVEGAPGSQESAVVGAGLTLADVAAEPMLRPWRALQRAAAQVATPHIRNAGTVGGNLCVDTRCNYYNQGYEWRKAIDFCMKRAGAPPKGEAATRLGPAEGGDRGRTGAEGPVGGETCWVAPGSPRCWAVSSTDLAPALLALGAEVKLVSKEGWRAIPIADLYHDDGIAWLAKRPDEIITEVRLGNPGGWRSTYWKLRRREAFDFPVLSVGAAVKLAADGTVVAARLAFGAVASHPVLSTAADGLLGKPLTDEAIARAADEASRVAKPLDNTDYSLGWRKRIARAYVEGALRELRGDDPAKLGLLGRRAASLPLLAE
jgi:4-hydroxybenzoyl-CoA reductase subunit beta